MRKLLKNGDFAFIIAILWVINSRKGASALVEKWGWGWGNDQNAQYVHILVGSDLISRISNYPKGKSRASIYKAFHILPHIHTANHETFPIQIYSITV